MRTELAPELEVGRLLGKGAMARILLAREPALKRLVAVKVLPHDLASDEVAYTLASASESGQTPTGRDPEAWYQGIVALTRRFVLPVVGLALGILAAIGVWLLIHRP